MIYSNVKCQNTAIIVTQAGQKHVRLMSYSKGVQVSVNVSEISQICELDCFCNKAYLPYLQILH